MNQRWAKVRPLYRTHQFHLLERMNQHLRDSLPFSGCNFRLRTIEDLLEFADPMPHARVQVSLRALDMIMQVVTEQLDVRDRSRGNGRIEEMAREEDESDVSDLIRLTETRDIANFKRWFAVGVEDLRSVLNGWKSPGIDEFLANH